MRRGGHRLMPLAIRSTPKVKYGGLRWRLSGEDAAGAGSCVVVPPVRLVDVC